MKKYLLTNGKKIIPTKEQWELICYPIVLKLVKKRRSD